jgi:hypothetical protein
MERLNETGQRFRPGRVYSVEWEGERFNVWVSHEGGGFPMRLWADDGGDFRVWEVDNPEPVVTLTLGRIVTAISDDLYARDAGALLAIRADETYHEHARRIGEYVASVLTVATFPDSGA